MTDAQLSAGMAGLRNVEQAAAFLGVSTRTVWNMKHDGELAHVRIGRRVLFTESDLIEAIMRARVAS